MSWMNCLKINPTPSPSAPSVACPAPQEPLLLFDDDLEAPSSQSSTASPQKRGLRPTLRTQRCRRKTRTFPRRMQQHRRTSYSLSWWLPPNSPSWQKNLQWWSWGNIMKKAGKSSYPSQRTRLESTAARTSSFLPALLGGTGCESISLNTGAGNVPKVSISVET